jgi:hypothetical protein
MTEAAAGHLVVADLDDELRLERKPLALLASVPTARTAGRLSGETGRLDQRL